MAVRIFKWFGSVDSCSVSGDSISVTSTQCLDQQRATTTGEQKRRLATHDSCQPATNGLHASRNVDLTRLDVEAFFLKHTLDGFLVAWLLRVYRWVGIHHAGPNARKVHRRLRANHVSEVVGANLLTQSVVYIPPLQLTVNQPPAALVDLCPHARRRQP